MYGNSSDFMPFQGTDFGRCAEIVGPLTFNKSLGNMTTHEKFRGQSALELKPDSYSGSSQGLNVFLDAEVFDYTEHTRIDSAEGFKVAVHHHLDKPLMAIKSFDLAPGFIHSIAITPVLYNTTETAINRFSPGNRECYASGNEI